MDREEIIKWLEGEIQSEHLLCELTDITEGFVTHLKDLIALESDRKASPDENM